MLGPEAGNEQRLAVVDALIGEVVDRVDSGAAVQRLCPLDGVDVDGPKRRLPVVGVDHVGDPGERLHELECAPRQEGEPLEVVRVRLGWRAVEVRTVEVAMMLEEVDRHLAGRQSAEADASVRHSEPHGHREDALQGLERLPWHAGVERHDDAHIESLTAERLREGPDHLPETAGLDERRAFGGDEEDFQRGGHGSRTSMGCSVTMRRSDSRDGGRRCPWPRCPPAMAHSPDPPSARGRDG